MGVGGARDGERTMAAANSRRWARADEATTCECGEREFAERVDLESEIALAFRKKA